MIKVFILFFLILLCSYTSAIELDTSKFMPLDQIKPGMKGIGKTVFSGTKIEEFQVEVLDIVKNAVGPKSDIIWVMCSGGPLEETGVISGMSGSPVYIDGKLIGAVAYRLGSFAKKPIAGITPIANMLEIIEDSKKEPLSNAEIGRSPFPEREFPFPSHKNKALKERSSLEPLSENYSSFMQIQTPVMMGGFSAETIEYIAPTLKELGMMPVQGGGISVSSDSDIVSLEPGAVVGIELVRGDLVAYASGTLTYIDGDKVLAFGHPMSGMGKTSLPFSIGKISVLVPSMMASSKQGSPIKTIGTLIEDNPYGIMSIIGKQPEFIPMKIKFRSPTRTQEYNFEIAKHRLYAPTFIFSIVLDTVSSAGKSVGDFTIKTHSEISIKGYPKVSKDNIYSGLSPDMVAEDFAIPIYLLMQNRFEEADIENLTLDITFDNVRTNALIEDVQIDKSMVKPGDSVNLKISITPYKQETIIKKVEVPIPKDVPEGRALLRISDASSSSSWNRSRAPMKSRITDINQLIKQIQDVESNNNIIIELFSPVVGMTVKGEELPALPLTAFNIINSSKSTGGSGPTSGTVFMKQIFETDYVISGSAVLPIAIDRDAP